MILSTPIAQGTISPQGARRRDRNLRRRAAGGFTLIEMLVSLAITLIMMGAVVTLFGVISDSVSGSRTMIEMADRLRVARDTLQLDLQGATATMTPPLRPENDAGYFEIIEGQINDASPGTSPNPATWTIFGDVDDVLMFTVRSRGAPFLGKSATAGIIESPVAEVVYFLVQDGPVIDATTNPPTKLCTLYRRALLVAPNVGETSTPTNSFQTHNDLSVHYRESSGTGIMVPNTLGDLTKRENRFAHHGVGTYGTFPFLVDMTISPALPFVAFTTPGRPTSWPNPRPEENVRLMPFVNERYGDDVLLTNVLAFDLRVWDPDAPMRVNSSMGVEPGDQGWTGGTDTATGAYVDLGYNTGGNTAFAKINPYAKPATGFGTTIRIYDTWSLHYENDGIDEDGDTKFDAATNGLDDDNDGLVDETDEYDTLPPYVAPLRGIRVTIRTYEPNSKQVREAVVIQNFDTK